LTRRRPQRLKILLSEAASTSARQTLYALGRLGHTIDVCDPQRLCLGRFSRYVRTWYRCPPFNTEPVGYVRFLLGRLRRGGYDVLFPVHDQVFLLSRFRQVLCRQAGLALPDFQSLKQVQSKVAFLQVLEKLKLPYPPTVLIGGPAELDRSWDYPCYVKLAYSTAGCGVWLVHSRSEMQALAEQLREKGTGLICAQHPPGRSG
jgi:predicted ATP-grasp superfamily ATP-dependent carboligase